MQRIDFTKGYVAHWAEKMPPPKEVQTATMLT